MQNNPESILDLHADLKYSQSVRHFSERFFIASDISFKWAKRLTLVLDELYMNAVSYGSSANSRILIKFNADNEKVVFSIQDDGTGKKSSKASELQAIVEKKAEEMDHRKTSGRGLSLITSQWTDECEADDVEGGGIKITCTKYRSGMGEEDELQENSANVIEIPANTEAKSIAFKGTVGNDNLDEIIFPVNELLKEQKPYYLILDFSQLEYFNSLFIGTLANWNQKISENKGKMVIVGATDSAREILELCGLDRIIPLYPDMNTALENTQKTTN